MTSNTRDCKHGQLARSCHYCESEQELADLRTQVASLRAALSLSLHAFRAQLSHGQRKGLAYGELTCLIALGEEDAHVKMGNCLTFDEEREHRERVRAELAGGGRES